MDDDPLVMDQRPYHFGMTAARRRRAAADRLTTYREPAPGACGTSPRTCCRRDIHDAVRAAGGVALLLPPGAATPT